MKNEPDPRIEYANIIDLPHYQSHTRPHMSLYERAAQFQGFKALVGYDDMVAEEQRETDYKDELSEDAQYELSLKLDQISDIISSGGCPEVSVTYFVPDRYKSGGSYESYAGIVKKIDTVFGYMTFYADNGVSDGEKIDIHRIVGINHETIAIET